MASLLAAARGKPRSLTAPILLSFSSLLAFRILMKMRLDGYSIYYNGPVILVLSPCA